MKKNINREILDDLDSLVQQIKTQYSLTEKESLDIAVKVQQNAILKRGLVDKSEKQILNS